jgi:hypothetical protein
MSGKIIYLCENLNEKYLKEKKNNNSKAPLLEI